MFKKHKGKLRNIDISLVSPNPNQPRGSFDEGSLLELAASIKEYGVLQPVTVRKVKHGFELIAGERRVRACELVGLQQVPAIVMDLDNSSSACLALIENLQRENLSYLDEAEGYYNLIEHFGLTQEQVAAKVGKSQSAIANKLRLLRMEPKVKATLIKSNLTERHARALLKLADSELQLDAIAGICARGLNVKQSEQFVEEIIRAEQAAQNLASAPAVGAPVADTPVRTSAREISTTKMVTHTLKRAIEMLKNSGVIAELEEGENEFRVLIKN